MRAVRFFLLGLALFSVSCVSAFAQRVAQNDLYLDAMQSLTEGRQTDASETLRRMVELEPQHAGAWLDLAIIQCELGRAEEAERLFQTIEARFSPPPAIREVISKLRAGGCQGWKSRRAVSVTLGRGIDSNVNQGASNPFFSIGANADRIELQLLPEFLPRSDQYTFLSGEYTQDINPNGGTVFAQLRAQQNDSLSAFDTSSLAIGMEQPWHAGDWKFRGSGVLALLGLGGKLYQRQAQAQVRITPPLRLPRDMQFSLLGGANQVEYVTLPGYDSTTWELRGMLGYRSDRSQVQASLGYLTDRAALTRPGGDRAGWFASLHGRRQLSADIAGELGWTGQTWVAQSPYSPGLIDQTRRQHTQVLRGALIIPVGPKQSMNVELRHVRNNENISIFQYNSRQLQVSWQWRDF